MDHKMKCFRDLEISSTLSSETFLIRPHSTMNPRILLVLLAVFFSRSLSLEADTKPISNITVIGAVFCDACSSNTFSNHSYFLQGAKVRVECNFRANSTSREDITITVDRTTDKFGIYKLDVPPVDGFECREGREIDSLCRATLIRSSSSLCNVPGLRSSTEHVAVKLTEASICVFNLNALNYKPAKKNDALCATSKEQLSSSLNTSLFFWPPFPPFGFPWPQWPPLPFPFPSPPSLPFPFPSPPSLPFPFPPIPFFTPPPSFPFPFPFPPIPFFTPPPPSFPFPFPFPPIPFFTPPPSPKPPAFPFPLPPSLFPPSPPPPSFTFPLPPLPPLPPFPPITPIPSLFSPPPPPPPSPPPPSFPFPFPFPPFPPLLPSPGLPSPPPPPTFSLTDPRTWFPFYPPSSTNQAKDQQP